VYVDVAYDALFVDNEEGALALAVLAQDVIALGHLTVGVKVAQERVSYPLQAFGPGAQARNAVYAYTQNLGIHPFEPVERDLVRRDLVRSDRRPG
jgi:hypothetical protein